MKTLPSEKLKADPNLSSLFWLHLDVGMTSVAAGCSDWHLEMAASLLKDSLITARQEFWYQCYKTFFLHL
jgi:hypothetical protein